MDLEPLITETYPFADTVEAFERTAEGLPADVKLQIKETGTLDRNYRIATSRRRPSQTVRHPPTRSAATSPTTYAMRLVLCMTVEG